MLKICQCQKPLPVGASGSYTVSAKLFASAGAPLHSTPGETFVPVHPQPSKTCSAWMVPLGWKAGLEIRNSAMRHLRVIELKGCRILSHVGGAPSRHLWGSLLR